MHPFSASMLEYLVFKTLRVQRPQEFNLQHNDSVTPWNAQDTNLQMYCRYLNDIINTRYICYVIHIYNIYLIKNNSMTLSMGASKKKKNQLSSMVHTPRLKWRKEHFHSLLEITDDKGRIFVEYSYSLIIKHNLIWREEGWSVMLWKPNHPSSLS